MAAASGLAYWATWAIWMGWTQSACTSFRERRITGHLLMLFFCELTWFHFAKSFSVAYVQKDTEWDEQRKEALKAWGLVEQCVVSTFGKLFESCSISRHESLSPVRYLSG